MSLPQHPRAIKRDTDGLVAMLIERALADDQNFAILRQLSGDSWEVSFGGAEHVSIAMGDMDYTELHRELSEKRSYSVKLLDGGLLQMMYLFEQDRLIRHRLAYYPSPSLKPFYEDPDSYLRSELFVDIVSRRLVPFPIRFDYDEDAARDVGHPRCHLTLGDIEGCRIPVSCPLTPRWFVEFVLRNFYQTEKHNFVDGLPAHQLNFPGTLTINEERLIHVVVPQGKTRRNRLAKLFKTTRS